jgi:hypothetical protein
MARSLKPAIDELEHIWDYLVNNYFLAKYNQYYTSLSRNINNFTQRPIITIQPQGRRKAFSWFNFQKWENKSNVALSTLAGQQATKLDEYVVTAELLKQPLDEIVKEIAIHVAKLAHQNSSSNSNFIGPTGYQRRVYGPILGINFTNGDKGYDHPWSIAKDLETLFTSYTMNDTRAFDTIRETQVAANSTASAGLKKWQCPTCKIPFRASRVIYGYCQCGRQFEYVQSDRFTFYQHQRHMFKANQVDPTDSKCQKCGQNEVVNPASSGTYRYYPHFNPVNVSNNGTGYSQVTIPTTALRGVL